MKIYTRTGDDGTTGLFGGARAGKDAPRIAAYGTVDELNAAIGLARALLAEPGLDVLLAHVQAELFVLGAELATAAGTKPPAHAGSVGPQAILRLEQEIDTLETELAPLRSFILPGGAPGSAALHLSRTVCRRAEREVLALSRLEPVRGELLRYLNRLSDHLFVVARAANHRAGVADVPWQPGA